MFDMTRIISGFVMIVAVIIIALIDVFWINFVVFGLLLYFAFDEAKKLFNVPNASFIPAFLAFLLGSYYEKALFFGLLLVILVVGYLSYKKAENLRLSLIYLYPTLPILALWQVYLDEGMIRLFLLILLVVLCDSGAYFIGKMLGKTPFSQTSPNKTLEGVVGGVLCAVVGGGLVGIIMGEFWLWVVLGFFVAVLAVIGDLIESYFKRVANLKDSGDLIPGHGGILDRIDAVMIASFAMVVLL
ncbi:phosphatidate cytidylyltransferase [Campylobacter upsaliensis]|uniref:phosphatidate cytidylyltransferase n=1 Tax=Campylobacter upsaliensis TaxID=28080 RepID=UPI001287330A|nr:phosphatidate cytidylyltransferase [Campylobacter upsaliensis]EAI8429610.1 phosphatidate cytidylyltransferase [Campylobacter upsaliensis]EAI8783045.1 phosphatidate cytidylyltransferase [Campylobacter upsaliensis]EAI9131647.1 phosphatidate cytidylyltransferase [Campylobacter upsaliensis]EAJ7110055.1 phosphatidate cytidylyltransferase [Campylobacter upsaliensis]EJF0770340.1 phosphatidate cytidylyltransferase [Campylobacter upsaliensis]